MGNFKINKAGMRKLERDLQKQFSSGVQVPLGRSESDAINSVNDQLKKMGVASNDGNVRDIVREVSRATENHEGVHGRTDALGSKGMNWNVQWRIEHASGAQYVLRNIGTDIAEHVDVDESRAPLINRDLPGDLTIQPGEGHAMLLKGAWGHPMANQLYVRWRGQSEWVAVPLT